MKAHHPLQGLYILDDAAREMIYGPEEQRELAEQIQFIAPPQTALSILQNPTLLREVEVIFSGWGAPCLDLDFLNAAPHLQAFFYGAGATGGMIHPCVWSRGVLVTSAAAINAIPVAEYTVAAIILSLKNVFYFMRHAHKEHHHPIGRNGIRGAYKATIGLVSFGAIGRAVRERLQMLDVDVIVYDPFVSEEEAQASAIRLVSLEELFHHADVVSLHTPWLPETEGLITGKHIASLKPGATLINTARGAIIREDEMMEILSVRRDVTAILDVTQSEPPPPLSPLWALPNLFLTPHIAGSMASECRRMGRFMVEEFHRYVAGHALQGIVHPGFIQNTSHRVPLSKT